MQRMSEGLNTRFHLTTNYRTNDEELEPSLHTIRTVQPATSYLADFFQGRHLSGVLRKAVWWTLSEEERRGTILTWLCVTHKRGVQQVNAAALLAMDPPYRRGTACSPWLPGGLCCPSWPCYPAPWAPLTAIPQFGQGRKGGSGQQFTWMGVFSTPYV